MRRESKKEWSFLKKGIARHAAMARADRKSATANKSFLLLFFKKEVLARPFRLVAG